MLTADNIWYRRDDECAQFIFDTTNMQRVWHREVHADTWTEPTRTR